MKSYSILRLQELKFAAEVLRACPQIDFPTANIVNKNCLQFEAGIKEYGEQAKLLQERQSAIKDNAEDIAKFQQEVRELNTKEFEITLFPISNELFKNIEGDKEVSYNDGTTKKYPYREAFFTLLGEIIIE